MKLQLYLLIDSDGVVQARKRRPSPRIDQVAIRLFIDLDDKWFVRPAPSIELTIPENHIQPMAIVQSEPIDDEQEGDEI